MILAPWVSFTPVANEHLRPHLGLRGLSSGLRSRSFVGCSCLKTKTTQLENEEEEGFSVLGSENMIWSTFALYMFCLHIPLSFRGLSIVANILHQKLLHPQTQVTSLKMTRHQKRKIDETHVEVIGNRRVQLNHKLPKDSVRKR